MKEINTVSLTEAQDLLLFNKKLSEANNLEREFAKGEAPIFQVKDSAENVVFETPIPADHPTHLRSDAYVLYQKFHSEKRLKTIADDILVQNPKDTNNTTGLKYYRTKTGSRVGEGSLSLEILNIPMCYNRGGDYV